MWRCGKILGLCWVALALLASPPAYAFDPPKKPPHEEGATEHRRDDRIRHPSRLYPDDDERRRAIQQFMMHDQARRAVETGTIRPLGDIRRSVQRQFKGRIVGIDLQERRRLSGPAYIYDVRVLTPRGDVLSVEMDAGTGQIIGVRGKR